MGQDISYTDGKGTGYEKSGNMSMIYDFTRVFLLISIIYLFFIRIIIIETAKNYVKDLQFATSRVRIQSSK